MNVYIKKNNETFFGLNYLLYASCHNIKMFAFLSVTPAKANVLSKTSLHANIIHLPPVLQTTTLPLTRKQRHTLLNTISYSLNAKKSKKRYAKIEYPFNSRHVYQSTFAFRPIFSMHVHKAPVSVIGGTSQRLCGLFTVISRVVCYLRDVTLPGRRRLNFQVSVK